MSADSSSSNHPVAPSLSRRCRQAGRVSDQAGELLGCWSVGDTPLHDVFNSSSRGQGTRIIHAPIKPIKDMQLKLAAALQAHAIGRQRRFTDMSVRGASFPTRRYIRENVGFSVSILKSSFPVLTTAGCGACSWRIRSTTAPTWPRCLRRFAVMRTSCRMARQLLRPSQTLICRGLDKELLSLARREHCHYSRYCDDLIFSATRKSFPNALVKQDEQGSIVAGPEITAIITKHGFRINSEKTHLRPHAQRQMVTGLVVNAKPNIPREYIRFLRNLLYIWRRYSQEDAQTRFMAMQKLRYRPVGKPLPALSFRWMIRGRVQYVGHIKGWTDPVYLALAKALASVDEGFKEPRIESIQGPAKLRLYVEGPTDVVHLQAALDWYRQAGQYGNLEVTIEALNGHGRC